MEMTCYISTFHKGILKQEVYKYDPEEMNLLEYVRNCYKLQKIVSIKKGYFRSINNLNYFYLAVRLLYSYISMKL